MTRMGQGIGWPTLDRITTWLAPRPSRRLTTTITATRTAIAAPMATNFQLRTATMVGRRVVTVDAGFPARGGR